MRVLPMLLCVLAVGCGSKTPAPVGNEAEPPPPPADPPPRTYVVPDHFAALGGACPVPDDGAVQCAICNDDGRAVAIVQPGDFLSLHGDPAVIASTRATDLRQWQWTIAVSGGVVRAQVLTCPHCRRQMGWSILIDLAELASTPEATRQDLQTALGYPASPLLTSEDDWRAAPPGKPGRVDCRPAG